MKKTLLRLVWCTVLLFPSSLSLHAEDFWQDTLWIRKLPLGGHTFSKVMFHPDGKSVYATSDQYLFKYDVQNGNLISTITMRNGLYIRDYELTSDNQFFIIATNSSGIFGKSAIEIWHTDTGYVRTIHLEYACASIALSEDNKYVFVGYRETFIHKILLETGEVIKTTNKANGGVLLSPDETEILSYGGSLENRAFLLDAETLEIKKEITPMYAASYDKTGRYIVGGGAKNIVYLYDREENKSYPLISHKEALHDVCFTSDRQFVVSAGYADSDTPEKGGYRIWSVETKQKIYEAPYYTGTTGFMALSPDNKWYGLLNGNFELTMWKFKNPIVGSTDNPAQNNSTLTITPNPTHSFIEISFPIGSASGFYTISDVNGKNVLHSILTVDVIQSGKATIDVSSLHNGMYTCTVTIGTFSYSSSFIINRRLGVLRYCEDISLFFVRRLYNHFKHKIRLDFRLSFLLFFTKRYKKV